MTDRNTEKIRRRRERLLKDKNPTAAPRSNGLWSGILFLVLLSTIAYFVRQSITNDTANEMMTSIIISITAFLVVIVWFLPKFYVRTLPNKSGEDFDREKERLKLEDDTRKTLAQIIGGIVFLGGLIFTYNTFRLQQDLYRLQLDSYALQQEGQFTDRFTKAVTQIGDNKIEVRLGGLYALERIAKDSPKDYQTVMEILSTYIRENSKIKEVYSDKNNTAKTVTDEFPKQEKSAKITTDIQAALTIIGRRNAEQDSKIISINLVSANLRGAFLVGANLSRASLIGTNLAGNYLLGTDLSAASLNLADLTGADLTGADLKDANLNGADLRGADLKLVKNLTFEQLGSAIIDKNTIFPENLENLKSELIENSKKSSKKLLEEINKR